MARLPRHLLERAPEETVRRLCSSLLDEAAHALERMDEPEDKEGLHDFRVSLFPTGDSAVWNVSLGTPVSQ